MSRFVVAFLSACALAPAAFGQIFYEPVRYQHVSGAVQTYYYAGSNPRAFYWAELQSALDVDGYNRHRYGAFSGGDRGGDGLLNQEPRVYADWLPYRDVRRDGYTSDDARNHAVRSAPRYFRKADLLRAGQVQPDGSIIVPSHPVGVVVVDRNARRGDATGNGATKPSATTGKILIIPRPKPAKSDKPIVASR